jgi:chorismate dehydratase
LYYNALISGATLINSLIKAHSNYGTATLEDNHLIIGKIPYANLFPIFHQFEQRNISDYSFIEGVPSKLNKMLRYGMLDISPSSSIEYLQNKDRYFLLPWFSVSSSGPINSILLFSSLPLGRLEGETIAVSSESETSTALLKIILSEFFSVQCRFEPVSQKSVKNILLSYPAVLHIGDTALEEARKLPEYSNLVRKTSKKYPEEKASVYIYDLGELWDKYTGLPFVYALWLVRKDLLLQKRSLIEKFSSDLMNATRQMHTLLPAIAKKAPQSKWLGRKELLDYWNIISYGFTERHLAGLKLFEKYVRQLSTGKTPAVSFSSLNIYS